LASNTLVLLKEEASYSREEVKRVFLALCDLEPAARRKQLEELYDRNQSLGQEVQRLVEYDSDESIFEAESLFHLSSAAPDEKIGQKIGGYKLVERIGEGSMGIVYRAEDLRLNRPVAVKVLRAHLRSDPRQREQFLREAQAGASLDHPSICAVYDFGSVDGCPYIVTAYIEGETLADAIRFWRLSPLEVIERVIEIAEGLQAAHAKGILHRDLKPDNVLLASAADGSVQAKIIDFGLARMSGVSEITEVGRLIGTAMYICPELLEGKAVDQRADIWSLGVMLYEMLAGRPPFDADDRQHLFYLICNKSPDLLSEIDPGLPKEAERITAKALAKNRDRRYQDTGSLLEDLRLLQQHLLSGNIEMSTGFASLVPRPNKCAA
jgi:eukaryotic-like serine/threonine-protein kinase